MTDMHVLLYMSIFGIILGNTGSTRKKQNYKLQSSSFNTHPYLVLLISFERLPVPLTICEGTIITHTHILTSAQCYVPGLQTVIVTGNIMKNRQQVLFAKQWIIHDNFKFLEDQSQDDIALVVTKEPLVFNSYVQPLRLPTPIVMHLPNDDNANCIQVGWKTFSIDEVHVHPDYISFGDPLHNYKHVYYVKFPLLNKIICQRELEVANNKDMNMLPSMVCGRFPFDQQNLSTLGDDDCFGHHGGPLICEVNGKWVQRGLVSSNNNCGSKKLPSVFTKVNMFQDWIFNITEDSYKNSRRTLVFCRKKLCDGKYFVYGQFCGPSFKRTCIYKHEIASNFNITDSCCKLECCILLVFGALKLAISGF